MCVSDIEGVWVDAGFSSGLVERCKTARNKPFDTLTNEEMATFLRQKTAVSQLLPLAERRIAEGIDDQTEMFNGELRDIVARLRKGP